MRMVYSGVPLVAGASPAEVSDAPDEAPAEEGAAGAVPL